MRSGHLHAHMRLLRSKKIERGTPCPVSIAVTSERSSQAQARGATLGGASTFAIAQGAAAAKIVIVGGGAGGATAALQLEEGRSETRRHADRGQSDLFELVLLEPLHRRLPLVRLPQSRLCRPARARRQGRACLATAIDTAKKIVITRDGKRYAYDRLVLSPGIEVKYDSIPGYYEGAVEPAFRTPTRRRGIGKQQLMSALHRHAGRRHVRHGDAEQSVSLPARAL